MLHVAKLSCAPSHGVALNPSMGKHKSGKRRRAARRVEQGEAAPDSHLVGRAKRHEEESDATAEAPRVKSGGTVKGTPRTGVTTPGAPSAHERAVREAQLRVTEDPLLQHLVKLPDGVLDRIEFYTREVPFSLLKQIHESPATHTTTLSDAGCEIAKQFPNTPHVPFPLQYSSSSSEEISFTEYAGLVMSTPAQSRGLTIKDGVLRCTFDHAALKLCIFGTGELQTEVDAVLGASKGPRADMSSVRDVGSKFKKPLLMALLHKWPTPDGETWSNWYGRSGLGRDLEEGSSLVGVRDRDETSTLGSMIELSACVLEDIMVDVLFVSCRSGDELPPEEASLSKSVSPIVAMAHISMMREFGWDSSMMKGACSELMGDEGTGSSVGSGSADNPDVDGSPRVEKSQTFCRGDHFS